MPTKEFILCNDSLFNYYNLSIFMLIATIQNDFFTANFIVLKTIYENNKEFYNKNKKNYL